MTHRGPKQAPPSPDYVSGLEYPEYLAPSNDEIPVEDQPLPVDASPTALSPGYVTDSDPEEDLEEDPKEDPADYPADGGDEEEEESSEDDDDKEEEKEHLAPADSTLPTIDFVPSAEEKEPFETDESAATPPPPRSPLTIIPFSQTRLRRARISVRPHTLPSPSAKVHIDEYAVTPTPSLPPPSPLTPLSSPLPQIPSPLLPVPSPPLLLPSADRRSDIPKANMPFWKRLCLTALALRDAEERAPTTLEEVDERVIDLATTLRQETDKMYVRYKDAQDDQAFLRAQINMLHKDRMEWQRQEAGDTVTCAFRRIHALEARDPTHPNGLEDASSSC
ncbi:hypothetical protein Tco_0410537 [Tanacetum coccineum]